MHNSSARLSLHLLTKIALRPLIFAGLLGIAYLLGRSFAGLLGPLNILVWLYVGWLSANAQMRKSKDILSLNSLYDLALNGAFLSSLCFFAYEMVAWISLSVSEGDQILNLIGMALGLFEAAIIGATATLAGYALQTTQTKEASRTVTVDRNTILDENRDRSTTFVSQESKLKMSQGMQGKVQASGTIIKSSEVANEPSQRSGLKVGPNMKGSQEPANETPPTAETLRKSKLKIKMGK